MTEQSIAEVAAALREANALNDTLVERGSRLVIAYHTAICSPKGVVPMDEFYDPKIAADIQTRMDSLRTHLNEHGEAAFDRARAAIAKATGHAR